MKVVLKERVETLGRRGEIVEVTRGHARNFLFPKGLAVEATADNVRRVEAERRAYLAREARRIEDAQEIAKAVSKLQVSISMKANEDGHLFGSVSDRVIADAFASEKIVLDPKMVRLDNPIRELGVFEIRLHLHPEVDVLAKIWVVPEKSSDAASAE